MSELRTIDAHIGELRKHIRQFSDDSMFDDEFLYKIFIEARATILGRQLEDLKYRSRWNWQQFIVPLDKADYYEDESFPEGLTCQVRKSKFKIPRPFSTKLREVFKVMTLAGIEISYGTLLESQLAKHSKTMGDKMFWEIKDDYLIIHNNLQIKALPVNGIFEDPLEVAEFPKYNTSGEYVDETCYNPHIQHIPMDMDLNDACYIQCLKKLGLVSPLGEDKSNNSTSPMSTINTKMGPSPNTV